MTTSFSAAKPALGYFYQVRLALYLLLTFPEDTALTIEKFDDVAFEQNGEPFELLQLKHRKNSASLTDTSSDLWKTIRIWSESIRTNRVRLQSTTFTLLTTGLAPTGSIADNLRATGQRNPAAALERLRSIAGSSKNQELRSCFDAFEALGQDSQQRLVEAIRVLDSHPSITDVTPLIKEKLNRTVHRKHRDALYERLEGWWFDIAIRHLSGASSEPISAMEVNGKIIDLGRRFAEDDLPIDFILAEPPNAPDAIQDNRLFVSQLRAIALNSKRIEKAIRDYYRAFEQRSRWVRDELLIDGELEAYERKLVDEWERFLLALQDKYPIDASDENRLCQIGRELYDWMEQEADYRLRPKLTEEYVMRGTFQYLADRIRSDASPRQPFVWWHPKFVERLEGLLATTSK